MILLIACFFPKAYELVEMEWGHFAGYGSEKNELLCLKIIYSKSQFPLANMMITSGFFRVSPEFLDSNGGIPKKQHGQKFGLR